MSQPLHFSLAAGQSLQFRARCGSTLLIEGGRAYLSEPESWLDMPGAAQTTRLLNGGGHRLARGGWLVVYAATNCRLTVVAPAPATKQPRFQLAALLARWLRLAI
ncbi:hypothetical protein [Chitinimonas sp.]|uniref:hypothetical protein n=1 Tax=Chitinimonas sp. TaxID=1934313 RepID=UPI002F92C4D5